MGRGVGHTLRVVTFNLKWGRQIDRAAGLFKRPGPLRDADLVVLEEMDRAGTERLASALGLSYVYVPPGPCAVRSRARGRAALILPSGAGPPATPLSPGGAVFYR